MRVVTHNLHAGVDGYGRLTAVVDATVAIKPDLLFAQEVWRGPDEDQFDALSQRLGLNGRYVALGNGERVTHEDGGRGWQSPVALLRGEEGLFFDERRELTSFQRRRLAEAKRREPGSWGVALLTNLPVDELSVRELPQLRRDKTRREYIVATLSDGDQKFHAVSLHGAHLTHGSLGQYRVLRRALDELSATAPVIVGGDFNCWRPLLRTVLPQWRSGVRAKTWPSWFPHSQIDHLLVRGPWSLKDPHAVRTPSDHRALVMEATLMAGR